MRTRKKANGIGIRMSGLSMLHAKVDYCRLSMHAENILPLLFFSVSSVFSVSPCWVEA